MIPNTEGLHEKDLLVFVGRESLFYQSMFFIIGYMMMYNESFFPVHDIYLSDKFYIVLRGISHNLEAGNWF